MNKILAITSTALVAASLLPALSGQAESAAANPRPIEFARDIQPIFADRCVKCHGPEKQKNGFRLDQKTAALRGGDSGKPAIVPGKSGLSPLVLRLTSKDPEEVMPPKGEQLAPQQIALIKKWIDAGAYWSDGELGTRNLELGTKKHWAFTPPVCPSVPEVKNEMWLRNPI